MFPNVRNFCRTYINYDWSLVYALLHWPHTSHTLHVCKRSQTVFSSFFLLVNTLLFGFFRWWGFIFFLFRGLLWRFFFLFTVFTRLLQGFSGGCGGSSFFFLGFFPRVQYVVQYPDGTSIRTLETKTEFLRRSFQFSVNEVFRFVWNNGGQKYSLSFDVMCPVSGQFFLCCTESMN